MCGIFGVLSTVGSKVNRSTLVQILNDLFVHSEARGKESSGLALKTFSNINVLKSADTPSNFVKSKGFNQLVKDSVIEDTPFVAIGHSRLVTNGLGALNGNNQPVVRNDDALIHNGIIVNSEDIWNELGVTRTSDVDTEALLALIQSYEQKLNRTESVAKAFSDIKGNASVCLISAKSNSIHLATDNGSLYYYYSAENGVMIFASEKYILKQLIAKYRFFNESEIHNLGSGFALELDISAFRIKVTPLLQRETTKIQGLDGKPLSTSLGIKDHSSLDYPDESKLQRCTKCLLPHSFPSITFDTLGVCNKCHEHEPTVLKDKSELLNHIERYRSKDGSPDCIVGLSGGRDSCYGLHIIKNELGLNPIAYTYDWGLVTDLARRNISRMCGKLGVEHILVSADLSTKRANVRKNIEAWLKRPDLSMIPLFMAGDKQFYYHAHQLRKQTGVDLFMFAAGNNLERTDFKLAFSGLNANSGQGVLTQLSGINKIRLAGNYASKFLSNPRYLNSSILDTLHAFYSSYLLKDDYFYLYHYYPWDESVVNNTLINEYEWECSPDTTTTWRIGDGTAAFYNYIYYVVCGFTEHDTFRSNQIREGVLSREDAFKLLTQDNKPRWQSLNWYANTIGFNLDEALIAIHKMKKLY
ncbi:glucosamine 6-phosphate synthetase [Enterovibrio norvegicus]|uniref:glucosamine 6-phosphate synthetase n=1 Tax=Enterovibrio norvegicus TaxID=188144 RepID=UPI0038998947